MVKNPSRFLSIVLLCSALFFTTNILAITPPHNAVASAHPLATAAGLDILEQGGNAFDAAVAVTATLAVVEPTGSGLGGGGFWLLHRAKDNFQTMIDGREKAPGAAHRDMYLDDAGNVIPKLSIDGPLAAGIPGVPAALEHLAKQYGTLPLKQTLAAAIRHASEGFSINESYRRLAKFRLNALRNSPGAAAIFLNNRQLPEAAYIVRQTDLAETLTAIAKQGAAGFYTGTVANKLVKGVRAAGGNWTLQDLKDYQIKERRPIKGHFQGIDIISASPPSSGGIALVTMLNILNELDVDFTTGTDKHLVIEAMRRAYRDRAVYLGDPDFIDIPTKRLIDPLYAAGLAASIRHDRATASKQLPGVTDISTGTDTTHFSILDKEGNRVAATLSINFPFGSAFVPPGTGVLLNDEMDDFSSKPSTPNVYGLIGGEANAIAPDKRPLSSMSPSFLESERGIAIVGTPGGSRIITMVLLAALDFAKGNGPDSWVNIGRFHHQFIPDVVAFEKGALTDNEIEILTNMGHTLKQRSRPYGNMQAILWDKQKNQVSAASDPRGSGSAELR